MVIIVERYYALISKNCFKNEQEIFDLKTHVFLRILSSFVNDYIYLQI